MKQNLKLSIIIPVYNEEKTIEKIIEKVKKSWENKQIIIVDDGSKDKTPQILKKIKEKDIEIYFHSKNQGKGAAIRTAVSKANGDCTIIQDADLEYDPQDFNKLLKPILDGKADVVYGSRFTGEHRNLLFWHWMGNRFLNLITNILYNTTISDMETGYKVFKTDILKKTKWTSNGFDFEPEITARILRSNIYIYEVPISYVGRTYREGKKIGPKDAVIAVWKLIKYRIIPL
jgi:glycosyltransferase involved in cell wall biosynthesis